MAELPLPLIRDPLVDPATGLVARSWVPWFNAWFRVLNDDLESVDFGVGPESCLLAATEAIRLFKERVDAHIAEETDTITRQDLRDAFDLAGKASATDGDPVAVEALNLSGKPGSFYQRFALAAT